MKLNAKVFFIFSALLYLKLVFSPGIAYARLIDRTAALVNADVITLSDVEKFSKNFSLRKELDPFISFFQIEPKNHTEIVSHLVQEALVLQKFSTTKEEIDEEINGVQRNNKIDREKLKDVLAGQGIHFDDYTRLMKVSLSKRKLVDRELRPLAVVSDEEVKNYYYSAPEFLQKKNEQKLVLTYSLLQLSISDLAAADGIYKKLRNGEDFDSVYSEYSGNSSFSVEKSNLGTFSEDKLSASVNAALQGLKVGEVSKPVKTANGYMILKITDIGAPKDPIFEKEKEQIRNKLFKKSFAVQLKLWTDREIARSYIHIPAAN